MRYLSWFVYLVDYCKIKWKGEFSEGFTIEQGVRQGGTLSADLYKIYVNHLLDILDCAGVGAKIGSIKCSAPFMRNFIGCFHR
jgi:hypothetical protein